MSIHLELKKLEKNLGLKLKQKSYCVGIDTASKTGIAIISTTASKVTIDTALMKIPSLPRDTEDKSAQYEQALDVLVNMTKDLRLKFKPKGHPILVLENSFMSINAWTYGYLKGFMGILYAILHDCFEDILIMFPMAARKKVGFKSTLPKKTKGKEKKAEIMGWVSKVIETEIAEDNIADAIVLALAGLVRND